MKPLLLTLPFLILTLSAMADAPGAYDWPQWQGPARDAVSKETGLLKEWPKEGPRLAWKATGLGGGDSTPSIAAGRIYGMSHRGNDEVVWALSEKDGKEIWAAKLGPAAATAWHQSKEGPACTPTIDGDRMYVIGLAGRVSCLKTSDGTLVWERNMKTEFGARSPMWSFRESPLVDGDLVICTPGGAETTMAALNKRTGETVWKTFVPDGAGGGGGPMRGPGGGPPPNLPNVLQTDLFLSGLDQDKDSALSAAELDRAPAVLQAMDKDQDGKLVEAELSNPAATGGAGDNSQRRRRGPGLLRMMKAHSTLDQDESDAIEANEMKAAVAMLKKLDEDGNGKLTAEEVGMKHMGPQDTGAAYSSAIVIEHGGQRQYVQFLAKTVAGVSAKDGKLLWRYDKPANGMRINISTPVYHEGTVFAASAYGAGGGLVRLVPQDGGSIAAEEAWFSKSIENHHGGVIIHDGAVYGSNGGNGGGYLVCLDLKTGDVLWNERDNDKRRASKGSVAFADGRLYYRTEDGTLLLIEPSRSGYLEKGRFEQPDRTRLPAWAHPVVANGKLYVRDQDTLYCYDIKAGQP
jgi:outer membrane protein assembly factor BamB/Ca2+-binding EF-hand superfamily protein